MTASEIASHSSMSQSLDEMTRRRFRAQQRVERPGGVGGPTRLVNAAARHHLDQAALAFRPSQRLAHQRAADAGTLATWRSPGGRALEALLDQLLPDPRRGASRSGGGQTGHTTLG
jgi:hypothetical protein